MKVTKSVPARVMVHGAAAVAVAAALLSGCGGGGGGGNSGKDGSSAQSDTFTRAFVPLNDGDKITYLETRGDGGGLAPFQVAAVVHGPAQAVSDVPVPVLSVMYSYVSDGVPSLTEYQTPTNTGFADYGTDYFVDTAQDPQGTPTSPDGSRPLPQPVAAVVQSSLHYPQSREIPFGLAAGASTPVVSDSVIAFYASNPKGMQQLNDTGTYRFTNQGRETVTVPMGTFSCIKIKAEYDSYGTTTAWYAEKIGLVKRIKERKNTDGSVDHDYYTDYEAVSASVGGKQYP